MKLLPLSDQYHPNKALGMSAFPFKNLHGGNPMALTATAISLPTSAACLGAGSWELDYGGLTSRCSCRSQSSCLSPCCQPARWTGKPALPTCHSCPSQLPQGAQAVLFQTYAAAGHCWPDVARIPLLPSFPLLIIPAIPTAWTPGLFRGLQEP